MRLVWTDDAREDLKQIARYVGVDDASPDTATKLIDRITHACELRRNIPEGGQSRRDLDKDVRAFTIDNFVVLYRVVRDEFQVLMVVRGARHIPALFAKRFPK